MNYSIAIADRVIIFVAMFMTALFGGAVEKQPEHGS
jgi:hypothetical protein